MKEYLEKSSKILDELQTTEQGLSEAEAVHDLITARTVEAAQNAAAQMMGAVGSSVQQMRDKLLGMVAHFHAIVDFPDEDIDPILFDDAAALLHQTTSQLYRMAESYERGRILREGVPCVILGRPNAGKSTLLNTLLGRERAIVTDIPGTTRDLIEENVKVGQILLRVTDTAGLRDTTDPVEQAGIDARWRKRLRPRSFSPCSTAPRRSGKRTCSCSPVRPDTVRSPC